MKSSNYVNSRLSVSYLQSRAKMRLHGIIPAALTLTLTCLPAVTASTVYVNRVREVKQRDSPVLGGYNADPNIAVFGNTYYIYPTTDGFPSWGGQTFYWWKSVSSASSAGDGGEVILSQAPRLTI